MIRNREGEYIRGIIASEPVHFMSEEERKNTKLQIETMKLDVGAVSRADLRHILRRDILSEDD